MYLNLNLVILFSREEFVNSEEVYRMKKIDSVLNLVFHRSYCGRRPKSCFLTDAISLTRSSTYL